MNNICGYLVYNGINRISYNNDNLFKYNYLEIIIRFSIKI